MPDFQAVPPKQTADALRSRHGSGAVLQACIEAYEALRARNISGCLYWREVLNILDAGEERLARPERRAREA